MNSIQPAEDDIHVSVGQVDGLYDFCPGPKGIDVLHIDGFCILFIERADADDPVPADGLLDEFQRPLFPDQDRNDRLGEENGALDRQYGQFLPNHVIFFLLVLEYHQLSTSPKRTLPSSSLR